MSASRVLFIFIVFALVVAGLLMVVSNMTAQPIGNGTYNAYAGYNGNGTVANLVGSVGTVTTTETSAGQGILIMVAAIVVICSAMMIVTVFKRKPNYR